MGRGGKGRRNCMEQGGTEMRCDARKFSPLAKSGTDKIDETTIDAVAMQFCACSAYQSLGTALFLKELSTVVGSIP